MGPIAGKVAARRLFGRRFHEVVNVPVEGQHIDFAGEILAEARDAAARDADGLAGMVRRAAR